MDAGGSCEVDISSAFGPQARGDPGEKAGGPTCCRSQRGLAKLCLSHPAIPQRLLRVCSPGAARKLTDFFFSLKKLYKKKV